MPYRWIEEVATADLAVEVTAPDLEGLLRESADALWAAQLDHPQRIEGRLTRPIALQQPKPDLLLYHFLQELLFRRDADKLFLKPSSLTLTPPSCQVAEFRLEGTLAGEPLDPARHGPHADVKAVTFHHLHVEKSPSGWRAFFILDL